MGSTYDSLRKEETEGEMFLTPNLFIIFEVWINGPAGAEQQNSWLSFE